MGTVHRSPEHETDLPEDWLAADKAQVSRAMEVMNETPIYRQRTLNSFKGEIS